jgi:hypothetical protein
MRLVNLAATFQENCVEFVVDAKCMDSIWETEFRELPGYRPPSSF